MIDERNTRHPILLAPTGQFCLYLSLLSVLIAVRVAYVLPKVSWFPAQICHLHYYHQSPSSPPVSSLLFFHSFLSFYPSKPSAKLINQSNHQLTLSDTPSHLYFCEGCPSPSSLYSVVLPLSFLYSLLILLSDIILMTPCPSSLI